MKIKKALNHYFTYPDNVKVHLPWSPTGLGDAIDWPEEVLKLFNYSPGSGRNLYIYQYFQNLKKQSIKSIDYLEVGTFIGSSVIDIYKFSTLFDINVNITVVDTFEGTTNEDMSGFMSHWDETNKFKNKFLENLKENNITNVNIYEGYSDDFFKTNKKTYDLIYIDADHSYEAVVRDINNSLQILNKNGKLTGDDYHPIWGVFNAVNSFANRFNVNIIGEMWYI